MFRNDAQISEVCTTLLSYTNKSKLWSCTNGPSREACDLYDAKGGYLSSGEWALLAFCFVLWNGGGNGKMAQLLQLDLAHRARVASLLACESSLAVDEWLTKHERPI